jgi:pyocin large subunit-like protein
MKNPESKSRRKINDFNRYSDLSGMLLPSALFPFADNYDDERTEQFNERFVI